MSTEPAETPSEAQLVRQGRKKFLAMAVTYSLGAFNDNFFKQAAALLAVRAMLEHVQGVATILFTLPFILLAAQAGWLADRFPKRSVIIAAKCLEVSAMILGALGLWWMDWTLILLMVTLMGVHSTIFGPSLNGSIPELYPASYVTRANAHMKVATTAAILLGYGVAGFLLGVPGDWSGVPLGRVLVAAGALTVAGIGLASAIGCPKRPAADPRVPFPWAGPWHTLQVLWEIRRDRLLAVTIVLDAFVWFLGAMQLQLTNVLGLVQLKATDPQTSLLMVAEMVGLAAGGILAGRLAMRIAWQRLLAPSATALGLGLVAMIVLQASGQGWVTAAGLLLFTGLTGGLMLIPLESFIQVRTRPEDRGSVIAAGNFAAFIGILIAGGVYLLFYPPGSEATAAWAPSQVLCGLGGLTLLVAMGVYLALKGVKE